MLKVTVLLIVIIPLLIMYELIAYIKLKRKHSIEYWILGISFYIYLMLFIGVTFFPIPIQKEVIAILKTTSGNYINYNIIPFHSILQTLRTNPSEKSILIQIMGNIILIMPITFYISLVNNRIKNIGNTIALVLFISILIELFQFIIGTIVGYYYRIIDIDDIILNTFGGILGYLFAMLIKRAVPKHVSNIK